MDAGLAAVCGALAGALATVGAAFAAGWAQQKGLKMGTRAAHLMERRQPRHNAYLSFITAASAARRSCFNLTDDSRALAPAIEERIHSAWAELTLLGPTEVVAAAAPVIGKALMVTQITQNGIEFRNGRPNMSVEDIIRQIGVQLETAIEEFSAVARTVLDDDGLTPARRSQ